MFNYLIHTSAEQRKCDQGTLSHQTSMQFVLHTTNNKNNMTTTTITKTGGEL